MAFGQCFLSTKLAIGASGCVANRSCSESLPRVSQANSEKFPRFPPVSPNSAKLSQFDGVDLFVASLRLSDWKSARSGRAEQFHLIDRRF